MKKLIATSLLGCLCLMVLAQQRLIKTIQTKPVRFATLDRAGDLYVLDSTGTIQKYDADGTPLQSFRHSTAATLFDTGNGVRLIAYYRSTQQYFILNPSLEVKGTYSLDSTFAIDPWLICPSGDYNLWILDAADWTLKRIDTRKDVLINEFKMDPTHMAGNPSIVTMREYQSFLFLLDANKGILIFNSLGRHIKTLPVKGLHYFNFLGEELYYPSEGALVCYDIFTFEKRTLPISNPGKFILLSDQRLFSVGDREINIKEFAP